MADEQRKEFGDVTHVSAVAVGVPGKRTFFLILANSTEWIRVWLEKEVLEALAVAVERLNDALVLESLYDPKTKPDEGPVSVAAPAGMPSSEVEVEQISLGYEDEKGILDLVVHPMGLKPLGWTELYCHVDLGMLQKFALQATKVCSAGRARCPLCGLPMDPEGHVCPESN
jgi:uncharacterized repeat protein (TIGR03847 family)